MSDYLRRLAARLVEPPQRIRPRAASPFEDDSHRGPTIEPLDVVDPRIAPLMQPPPTPRPVARHDIERPRRDDVADSIDTEPTALADRTGPDRSTAQASAAAATPQRPARDASREPAATADEPRRAPASEPAIVAPHVSTRTSPLPSAIAATVVPDAPRPAVEAMAARPRPSAPIESSDDGDAIERRRVQPSGTPRSATPPARGPSRRAQPVGAAPAPAIHVTIERVDVRAPAAPAARPTPPSAPRFDLQGYLRERGQARRR